MTPGFFAALGATPVVGGVFTARDLEVSRQVAVISHGLWRRRFGGSVDIVGRTMTLNGKAFRILAVMPPRVEFPDSSEIWIPSGGDNQLGGEMIAPMVVARLERGVTLRQAREEMTRFSRVDSRDSLRTVASRIRVVPLRDAIVGDMGPILVLLVAAVALLLIVTCLNAANLLLARVAKRSGQFEMRRILGASPWRLARRVLFSVVLSLLAGVAAIPAAIGTLRGVTALLHRVRTAQPPDAWTQPSRRHADPSRS